MNEKKPNPRSIEGMSIEGFNDELFGFLDAQPGEEASTSAPEIVGNQPEPADIAMHRMLGKIWKSPVTAPGEILDTTPETGSKSIELEGLRDLHSAITLFMNENSIADTLVPSIRYYKTGDGDGTAYSIRFFPEGRDRSLILSSNQFKSDGSFVDYPIDISNSGVREGVSRNEPVDEPNICLNVLFKSKKSQEGEIETDVTEDCTINFPHANFLLPPDDPRHPDNWDSARVQKYLNNVISPLLKIKDEGK